MAHYTAKVKAGETQSLSVVLTSTPQTNTLILSRYVVETECTIVDVLVDGVSVMGKNVDKMEMKNIFTVKVQNNTSVEQSVGLSVFGSKKRVI